MWEFKQTEIATRIIDDFDNFLDGKFDQMGSIKLIVEELNILKIINQALYIKIREYHRKYFTTESVGLLGLYFSETDNAGKLVAEYFNTQEDIFKNKEFITSKLYDELNYVQNLDIKFRNKLDKLIQQETMSKVINDVF